MIVIKIWGLHRRLSQLESTTERWLEGQNIEFEAEDVKEWCGDRKYHDVYFKIDSNDHNLFKSIEKKFERSDINVWMESEWRERMG
jgi:hypothetical protein